MRFFRFRLGDIVAMILGAALFIGACILLAFPELRRPTNWGFGSEWACMRGSNLGPVCVKTR